MPYPGHDQLTSDRQTRTSAEPNHSAGHGIGAIDATRTAEARNHMTSVFALLVQALRSATDPRRDRP